MARPATIQDVTDRMQYVAQFEIDKISVTSALLKAYTMFLEAIEKAGGEVEASYNNVRLHRPKTESELKQQLHLDQSAWDRYEKLYIVAVKADPEAEPMR